MEEMAAQQAMQTFTIMPKPPGVNVIDSRWVYKLKKDSAGRPTRYKARLVAKGFTQVKGLDFDEVFSPTVSSTSVRLVLALAAAHDMELMHLDFDTAFLNADVKEDIYLSMPPGYEVASNGGEQLVLKLNRSLYGLKQSPRNWNLTINDVLLGFGLERSKADPCVYVKQVAGGGVLIVVLYVDDVIGATDSPSVMAEFSSYLQQHYKCKLGELEFFVGIRVTRDRANRTIYLDQQAYLESVLERYNMADCATAATPATAEPLTADMCPSTAADEEFMSGIPYRSAVGSLLYASTSTRPDIANAVRSAAKFMQRPGKQHWTAVKRILRYVRGTIGMQLRLGPGNADTMASTTLIGYCDADYAGDDGNGRSTTGFIFTLGPAAVSWSSRLQATVAKSSTEAEYMALDEAVSEVLFLSQLLCDMRMPQQLPIVVYEDNQSAIKLAANMQFKRRTRHIRVRYHFIRECIAAGTIKLEWIPTADQLADVLTKNVDTATQSRFLLRTFSK